MEHQTLTNKLLDLAEYRSGKIAERWYDSIITNPRTISYHSINKERLIHRAQSFYSNLKWLYLAEDPYQEVLQFLERTSYVVQTMDDGTPLPDALYALVMMRRHIWLYAEMQALFNTALDMYQAVESINRTLLIFDYAMYILAQKYGEINS
jgi:hypothetical protein